MFCLQHHLDLAPQHSIIKEISEKHICEIKSLPFLAGKDVFLWSGPFLTNQKLYSCQVLYFNNGINFINGTFDAFVKLNMAGFSQPLNFFWIRISFLTILEHSVWVFLQYIYVYP